MTRFYVLTKNKTFYISVDLEKAMEIGGEGNVYTITTPYLGECIFKHYRNKDKAQRLREKILYLMRNEPPKSGKNIMFCWPVGAVYTENRASFVGFIMSKAFIGSRDLTILSSYSPRRTIADDFPDDKEWHKVYELMTKRGLRNRCAILNNWACAIGLLHGSGRYILGDIKPENIMVEPRTGRISVIDIDSCQVSDSKGNMKYPRTAQTPNYRPPEVHSSISDQPIDYRYDSFSFAVSAYTILTGTHPYSNVRLRPPYLGNPKYAGIQSRIRAGLYIRGKKSSFLERIEQCDLHSNLDRLPITLQDLFNRAFNNTVHRPTMDEWKSAFRQTIKDLENV
jgi:DNA-binding helix-hairpin-helix protein with protein kinase domain